MLPVGGEPTPLVPLHSDPHSGVGAGPLGHRVPTTGFHRILPLVVVPFLRNPSGVVTVGLVPHTHTQSCNSYPCLSGSATQVSRKTGPLPACPSQGSHVTRDHVTANFRLTNCWPALGPAAAWALGPGCGPEPRSNTIWVGLVSD